jgi:cytochrome c peroxidase
MKKIKSLFTLTIALASVAVVCSSCAGSTYKQYAGDEPKQVAAIMRDNGCMDCHTTNAPTPWYGSVPVIGTTIKNDIIEGEKYFLLDEMMTALDSGKVVSEVDLAKIENTALSGSMPPAIYYRTPWHWGQSLNKDEKNVLLAWVKDVRKANYLSPTVAQEFENEPVQPLMDSLPTNPAKVALGSIFYHDTRLSADNTVSCATCHDLAKGGVDRLQFSEGIGGQFGGVNPPTVYNAALNFVQFWDGRAKDLQEQAAGPPLNPVEMGHKSFDDICAVFAKDAALTTQFMRVYPDGWSQANITDAIAEFEKTLLTPSRFDKYLRGDKNALTAEEIEGYEIFKAQKCATCHVGVNLGGQSYEYFGIKSDYFNYRGTGLTDGDNGRYSVTKNESDRHKFKTPTLRNVMITYPYMHDGNTKTVEDAIILMGTFQGGEKILKTDVDKITLFLKTLTGEYKGELLN